MKISSISNGKVSSDHLGTEEGIRGQTWQAHQRRSQEANTKEKEEMAVAGTGGSLWKGLSETQRVFIPVPHVHMLCGLGRLPLPPVISWAMSFPLNNVLSPQRTEVLKIVEFICPLENLKTACTVSPEKKKCTYSSLYISFYTFRDSKDSLRPVYGFFGACKCMNFRVRTSNWIVIWIPGVFCVYILFIFWFGNTTTIWLSCRNIMMLYKNKNVP